MYWVYILFSLKLNKRYIGVTGDLEARLKQHNHGQTPFTSRAKDWVLIYKEAFISRPDAYAEEKFLKSGKGRERLKFLLQDTMDIIWKSGRAV